MLAEVNGRHILLDLDANGSGWGLSHDVDPERYDLLTTLAHELGHILGLDHTDQPGEIMSEELGIGIRHDSLGAIDNFFEAAITDALDRL